MEKSSNLVLYERVPYGDGKSFNREARFSVNSKDENAASLIAHHKQHAASRAIGSGKPCPVFDVIKEERESNEAGQQTSDKFTPVSHDDFKPLKAEGV